MENTLKDYDVYATYQDKYRKKNWRGLRLRSIMRVFNYIYRNNDKIYSESLINWNIRL